MILVCHCHARTRAFFFLCIWTVAVSACNVSLGVVAQVHTDRRREVTVRIAAVKSPMKLIVSKKIRKPDANLLLM
jgi:hypothetical protein